MKTHTLKLIPKLIALSLCSAIAFGCASQDSNDTKPKKQIEQTAAELVPAIDSAQTQSEIIADSSHQHANSRIPVALENPTDSANNQDEPSRPDKSIFYFAFNTADVSQVDQNILKEHARFLLEHNDMLLEVDGHTDFHGSRTYNETLSKKRAENVAKVLIEEGVPQSQLIINALADNKPLECKNDTRHNRRVELQYKNSNLAIAQ